MAFVGLGLAALSLVGVLTLMGEPRFGRFFGTLPPMAVFAVAIAAGGLVFAAVVRRAGFTVLRAGDGWYRAVGAAAGFGAVMIVADCFIVFPRDINVSFPRSLLFYPAMGFLVEIVFRLLPLSVLLIPAVLTPNSGRRQQLTLAALAATAFLEPAYQTLVSGVPGGAVAVTFVFVFLLAFSVFELSLFRRFDFTTMLRFRLSYYLVWHVAWGALRLKLLF